LLAGKFSNNKKIRDISFKVKLDNYYFTCDNDRTRLVLYNVVKIFEALKG
jgi:hypothetical protein